MHKESDRIDNDRESLYQRKQKSASAIMINISQDEVNQKQLRLGVVTATMPLKIKKDIYGVFQ
ncbi:MAG: hypothetical protein U1C97_02795 [Candidatus Gracilibacteria bacterium]|nr:hypothetical protein [bacterium]MDZ4217222.1 hypothetical protein [Candidatus Gracilibacteria bacterium]